MKRIAALLLALALTPACAFAFDLSPYILPLAQENRSTFRIMPISADAYYAIASFSQYMGKDDLRFLEHLLLYENGACTHDVPLPDIPFTGYSPVLRGDRVRILQSLSYPADSSEPWKYTYTLFDIEGDSLSGGLSFSGNPYLMRDLGVGFAGVCAAGQDQTEVVVYDEQAQPVFRHMIPFERAYVQDFTHSGGALYLLIKQHGLPSVADCIILRISGDQLSWIYHTTDEIHRYNSINPDGHGGVLLSGSLREDYKQYRIMRVDSSGQTCWAKTLRSSNAVIHPLCAIDQQDGTVRLYGRCIAKSRGLFTVFSATIDEEGDILSLDVRDYSARADTGPELLTAADGTILVYSFEIDAQTQPGVLVPFEALPAAENPGIRLS